MGKQRLCSSRGLPQGGIGPIKGGPSEGQRVDAHVEVRLPVLPCGRVSVHSWQSHVVDVCIPSKVSSFGPHDESRTWQAESILFVRGETHAETVVLQGMPEGRRERVCYRARISG